MSRRKKLELFIAAQVFVAGTAWAQMVMQAPQIPGEFKPVVGSGAQYALTDENGKKMDWVYAVVGKESVDGAEGYWLEIRAEVGSGKGMMMKELVIAKEAKIDIKRMIMQPPGRPPMEVPVAMTMGIMKRPQEPPSNSLGEKVGTETIAVPAGTFLCDHYKAHSVNGSANGDVWISTKVPPYGLIKMVSPSSTMILEKILSNQTSQITGTPMPMPHY